MALGDTGKAIGATTEALRSRLQTRSLVTTKVSRPDEGTDAPRLNLFLYEIVFDPGLKNVPLDDGQPAPLWLTLKYMLTAFDNGGDSDSVQAYELLGEGVRALQELNYLTPPGGLSLDYLKAMTPNPEDLKITFDEAPPDLLSKLMQGSNDKYHLSVAFQVRPVLIAPAEPASYSLLVGVDYVTPPPPTVIGGAGVRIPVLPSMGPTITAIEPESFEVGDFVTVHGADLHLSGLSVMLGPVELPATMQRPDRLQFEALADRLTGDVISAGGQPLTVTQALSPTRRRRSNVLVANLLPTLNAVTLPVPATIIPAPLPARAHGTLALTGLLLGKDDDDVFIALYRDGQTVRTMDYFTKDASIPPPPPPPPVAPQTRKHIVMLATDAVVRGRYHVILRVNGQQAKQSPTVDF